MAIGNASAAIDKLNAATTFIADKTTGQSQALDLGEIYTLQAITDVVSIGFGSTAALAVTDAASGEQLAASTPARVLVSQSPNTKYVACSGVGTLRIRKARVDP